MFGQLFQNLPVITKNLLIINIIVFVASLLFQAQGIYLNQTIGLYYFQSELFKPFQLVTHMFAHGSISHIFFNMFALTMFGSTLEKAWGEKKFLFFYLFSGFGAVFLHVAVQYFEIHQSIGNISILNSSEVIPYINGKINEISTSSDVMIYNDNYIQSILKTFMTPTVGASGAIYGLLLGFGMLFPNTELMLIFLPIPIKAKYFIPVLMFGELFMGIQQFSWDNIAHFAHLGGALFGLILVLYWKKDRTNFY